MNDKLGTINIDKAIVGKVRLFCAGQGISMKSWVEKLLLGALNNNPSPTPPSVFVPKVPQAYMPPRQAMSLDKDPDEPVLEETEGSGEGMV